MVKTVKSLPKSYYLVLSGYSYKNSKAFIDKYFFFNDPVLKKHYENNDITKFRNRVSRVHGDKTFDSIVHVLVTETIRPVIYDILEDLTKFLDPMGDLILSGGEAHNHYIEDDERIITSDIDTKFVPRIKPDQKFFGKLQAIKLLLWNKLGELAKQNLKKIKKSVFEELSKDYSKEQIDIRKISKFIGILPSNTSLGKEVTRRYTLIPKRKFNRKNIVDTLIDVEVFTLDFKLRYFDVKAKSIKEKNFGGILDIAFMRPKQLGYDIVRRTKKVRGYRTLVMRYDNYTQKYKNIKLPTKEYLLEDLYVMSKMGLRPEKVDKDRKRMVLLAKQMTKTKILNTDSMDTILKKVKIKKVRKIKTFKSLGNATLHKASEIKPERYEKYTTEPDKSKLSRQIVHGIKTSNKNFKTPPGYIRTQSNHIFNIERAKWIPNPNTNYVKNEFNFRPIKPLEINKNVKMEETLYGFKPIRDHWVPKPILEKSAMIPFIGLKK